MQPEVRVLVEPAASLEEAFLRALTSIIGQRPFEHWFHQKTAVVIDGDECTVLVGNPFLLKWLQKQFRQATQLAAEAALGPSARVKFDVPSPSEPSPAEHRSTAIPQAGNSQLASPHSCQALLPVPQVIIPPSKDSSSSTPRTETPRTETHRTETHRTETHRPEMHSLLEVVTSAELNSLELVETDAPYSSVTSSEPSGDVTPPATAGLSTHALSQRERSSAEAALAATTASASKLPAVPSVARSTAARDPYHLSFDTLAFAASKSSKSASSRTAIVKPVQDKPATARHARHPSAGILPAGNSPAGSPPAEQPPAVKAPGGDKPVSAKIPNYIQPAQQLALRDATRVNGADSSTPTASAAAQQSHTGRKFADLQDFVSGPANELALTAAWQVCQFPGQQLNPLVICGNSGLGKTHLLEGIHRQLRQRQPAWQVMYITAEAFANYFTQALREHTLPSFRQKFRNVDVLLMDDVEFFEGKRAIQEEFLHTFKHLASHGRQIVIALDRHPRLMTRLTDDLRTRLVSGMVCRVEMPDLETREKIVTRRAGQIQADIAPEALRYIAGCFTGSVRELEGAVNSLATLQTMTGKRVTLTTARKVLSDLERDCVRIVKMGDVERAVCQVFGVDAQELRSSSKARSVTQPRMLAMYLARKHTQAAYSEIGEYFGGRDHTTVIAAERKVTDWLSLQSTLKVATQAWPVSELIDNLEHQLRTA